MPKKKMVKQQPPRRSPYIAKSLKRKKSFAYAADVHIYGDVLVAGRLIVGGNLVVEGNLRADGVSCLGKITVGGDLMSDGSCLAGSGIQVDGAIGVDGLVATGCVSRNSEDSGQDQQAAWLTENLNSEIRFYCFDSNSSDYFDKRVHPDSKQKLDISGCWDNDIFAGKSLDCFDICVRGNVTVQDWFAMDDGLILGNIIANGIGAEGNLYVEGGIMCSGSIQTGACIARDIYCARNLFAYELRSFTGGIFSGGHINASDITCGGDLESRQWIASSGTILAAGYIKAGLCIVADKAINAGTSYGVLAGLDRPRSTWHNEGYISAPENPRNILTGRFLAGVKSESIIEY